VRLFLRYFAALLSPDHADTVPAWELPEHNAAEKKFLTVTALSGAVKGSSAVISQPFEVMRVRSQLPHSGSVVRTLYAEGGIPRFYTCFGINAARMSLRDSVYRMHMQTLLPEFYTQRWGLLPAWKMELMVATPLAGADMLVNTPISRILTIQAQNKDRSLLTILRTTPGRELFRGATLNYALQFGAWEGSYVVERKLTEGAKHFIPTLSFHHKIAIYFATGVITGGALTPLSMMITMNQQEKNPVALRNILPELMRIKKETGIGIMRTLGRGFWFKTAVSTISTVVNCFLRHHFMAPPPLPAPVTPLPPALSPLPKKEASSSLASPVSYRQLEHERTLKKEQRTASFRG
jgi:hypothetical protein